MAEGFPAWFAIFVIAGIALTTIVGLPAIAIAQRRRNRSLKRSGAHHG